MRVRELGIQRRMREKVRGKCEREEREKVRERRERESERVKVREK